MRIQILLALALVVTASTGWAESNKVWSLKPDKGFIDDPMAFDHNEGRFAYVHTDSAEFMRIVVVKTSTFKPEVEIKIGDATRVPKDLVFTPDGRRLIFVWMDGYKGTHGAMLFDLPSGKMLKKSGTATHAAVVSHQGRQLLTLANTQTKAGGGQVVKVVAYKTKRFRRAGGGTVTVGADLRIKKPALRLLYWEPGHLTLMGMQKGKYDKKRDIRLPERGVRYDVLKRKVIWAEEPKDVVGWHKATTMRPNHVGQLRFLEVSDDLKSLHSVDANNNLGKMATPVKWSLYEPKSLRQTESWNGKTLHFSMTIDPVNPDAVRRKKADPERVDIYRVAPGAKAVPVGKVLTGKRRFGWKAGSQFFAYLVKLKGFGRGGKEIRLYRVGR